MDVRQRLTKFWTTPEGIGRPMFQLRFETYDPTLTPCLRIANDALDLADQLRRNREVCAYPHDFVARLFPYTGTTAFASAFGAPVLYVDGGEPICEPILHTAQEAMRLEMPALDKGDLGRALEKTEYFLEQTKGEYPISVMDMQGPFDTAQLIWDKTDMMISMYEDPEAVHHVMDVTTELFIAFGRKLRQMIPDFVPLHTPNLWAPADYGISVSEDSIVMLGKDLFDEFVLPYFIRISQAFGGLILHSCGDWRQHLQSVKQIPGLKAINFGAGELPMEEVAKVFDSPDNAVKITMHTGLNLPRQYRGNLHFIQDGLDKFQHWERLYFMCWGGNYNQTQSWEYASYSELTAYLEQKGIGLW